MDMADFFGFDIFKEWHCQFPIGKLSIEGIQEKISLSEPRIDELIRRIDPRDKRILELGSLEGLHSFMLHSLGVREVIAIEGRAENFLKCLIVKNSFNLNRCKFFFGDLKEILPGLSGTFDICLALGILYHLDNPISILYQIGKISKNLFAWTHYSTDDFPEGPLVHIQEEGKIYRGKYVEEDKNNYLSGLYGKAFWIWEGDILKLVRDAGFREIEIIHKEKHEHGPAVTFMAKNNSRCQGNP